MKCQHCEYKDGYDWDEDENYTETKGEFGGFWTLPVKMERQVSRDYYCDGHKTAKLMACPKCAKTFIDE